RTRENASTVRHHPLLPRARIGATPEFAAISQIVPDRESRFVRRAQCFSGYLGSGFAQRGSDAADVKPANATEDRFPIDFPDRDLTDRRAAPVIKHTARARRCAELGEVEAGAISGSPLYASVHTQLAGAISDEVAQRIVRKTGYPARGRAESSRCHGDVELPTSDVDVEASRLLEPLEMGWREANHRFTKGDQVHAQSYGAR